MRQGVIQAVGVLICWLCVQGCGADGKTLDTGIDQPMATGSLSSGNPILGDAVGPVGPEDPAEDPVPQPQTESRPSADVEPPAGEASGEIWVSAPTEAALLTAMTVGPPMIPAPPVVAGKVGTDVSMPVINAPVAAGKPDAPTPLLAVPDVSPQTPPAEQPPPLAAAPCDPDGDGKITDRFTDPAFLGFVRKALALPSNAPITVELAQTVTELKSLLGNFNAVQSLNGIECFVHLQTATLHAQWWSGKLKDIAALGKLADLRTLSLAGSAKLADLTPVSQVHTLQSLALTRLPLVKSLAPVAALTNLQTLRVWMTPVQSVAPLAELTQLTTLELVLTAVTSLQPLAPLNALTELEVVGSILDDIWALQHMEQLQKVNLNFSVIGQDQLAPLVANAGFGTGDVLWMHMDQYAPGQVDTLIQRGVTVLGKF